MKFTCTIERSWPLLPAFLALAAASNRAQDATSGAAAKSASGVRVLLESASGEVQARDLAGFTTSDPRELGARLVRFDELVRNPDPPGA